MVWVAGHAAAFDAGGRDVGSSWRGEEADLPVALGGELQVEGADAELAVDQAGVRHSLRGSVQSLHRLGVEDLESGRIRKIEKFSPPRGRTGKGPIHGIPDTPGLLDKVPKRGGVYGDRGYDSQELRDGIQGRFRVACIAFRAPKREREGMKKVREAANTSIARTRARVEHVFGSIRNDMNIQQHRGVGLKRARSELLLEHVVYNMRRLVHLVEAGSAPS